MRKHYLTHFFDPSTIAVIGAGERNDSVDVRLFERLKEEFKGKIWLVNPRLRGLFANRSFATVDQVPGRIDLAIIVTPDDMIAEQLERCADVGIDSVVVLSHLDRRQNLPCHRASDGPRTATNRHALPLPEQHGRSSLTTFRFGRNPLSTSLGRPPFYRGSTIGPMDLTCWSPAQPINAESARPIQPTRRRSAPTQGRAPRRQLCRILCRCLRKLQYFP